MRCPDPPAHPASGGTLRGPLLALGALAALSLGVYVASPLGGVLVAAVVVVYATAAAGIVVFVRRYVRPARRVGTSAPTSNRAALPVAAAPLALAAARPAVQGVVVSDGEKLRA